VGAQGAQGAGKGEEGRGGGVGCCGGAGQRGGTTTGPTDAVFHGVRRRGLGVGLDSLVFSFFQILFVCDIFGARHMFLGQAGAEGGGRRGVCSMPPSRRQRTGNPDKKVRRRSPDRLYASTNKQKKTSFRRFSTSSLKFFLRTARAPPNSAGRVPTRLTDGEQSVAAAYPQLRLRRLMSGKQSWWAYAKRVRVTVNKTRAVQVYVSPVSLFLT